MDNALNCYGCLFHRKCTNLIHPESEPEIHAVDLSHVLLSSKYEPLLSLLLWSLYILSIYLFVSLFMVCLNSLKSR
jgi:hypothetical protein